MTPRTEKFTYDDAIVRKFLMATILWGAVGMLVGVLIALELVLPRMTEGISFLSFGRLRPLHTNAVIFAFAGNAFFCGAYYSAQRLLKARMFSDLLSKVHFWGWQLIIVSAALTYPFGITSGKEYAELEWPIDVAVAVIWVVFAVNFFGTIAKRRERHLYVAIWFYIASIVTVAVLHIFNSLAFPVSLTKSYSIYAGVQDAFMQWWYGHNAVAFFLTTPFLGLMYYFLPKAAERPVYSYRLSILHFWSIVFLYIWAGPHHLQLTALPMWAATLGMVFSIMLWMPSWGGMINGLLTLRGAWSKVASEPVLKFYVVAITFYGMSTFEGPMLSIRSVNGLAHYTDWIISHAHGGALGWNGFLAFGIAYWLAPRVFQTKQLYSKRLAEWHFWIGTVGILLYIVALYSAGLTQGLMWRAFDEAGRLKYPDFVETVVAILPMYWVRAIGGILYLAGACIGIYNIFMTWKARPATYEVAEQEAAPLEPGYVDEHGTPEPMSAFRRLVTWLHEAPFHRRWERLPLLFTVLVVVAVVVASLFEIVPLFLIRSNVPTIASVKPYTPLELEGRDIYIREGCYTCHSQMVRPMIAETERYGEYSKAGEFVYDHPFQWGSRRTGPDLARIGGKYPNLWHVRHMENPRAIAPQSIMPSYPWLLERTMTFALTEKKVAVMSKLGVPYDDVRGRAVEHAKKQAAELAAAIQAEGGPADLADKEMTALVAYLQRLGTDIKKMPPATAQLDGGSTP